MKRSLLVASLPKGPQDPVRATVGRALGSVRRTTVIDQRQPGFGQPRQVVASGRDLLTRADGSSEVVDEVSLTLEAGVDGTIDAISTTAPVDLSGLAGLSNQAGFRKALDALLAEAAGESVLRQLLDDVPMAELISGYGIILELGDDWDVAPESVDRLADQCAGWERGATMLGALEEHEIFPIPVGAAAPELETGDDPLAWHEHEPMVPRSIRRRRRIDVVAGDPLVIDAHFRDSHLDAEGLESVLHEYTLQATVDPETLVVLSSEATARTLPWPECPNALVSARWVVGEPVTGLRRTVARNYRGVQTCTHLNDVLRSLAGVAHLAAALP